MQSLKNIKWPNVDWRMLILVAMAWRIALVFLFSWPVAESTPDRVIAPGFGMISNDYSYYIIPAENLLTEGEYTYRKGLPFAGRMPGYAAFYLLFRLFLSQEGANLMMIVAQALLGGLGVYFLARAAEMFFKRKDAFWITFALGMLYPVSAFFDYRTITEGLAISALSFCLYLLFRGLKNRHWALLAGAGLMLAWAFFLRPFLGILVPLLALFVLWQSNGSWKARFSATTIFILPFVILLGAWNLRNYQQFGKVVIMQTSGEESYGKIYSRSWSQIRSLIVLWGGETGYFEPHSEAEWFRIDKSDRPLNAPAHIYSYGCFSAEDMQELKKDYQQFHYSEDFDTLLNNQLVERAAAYVQCFKEHRSFSDRTRQIQRFVRNGVFRSGSSYMINLPIASVDKLVRLLFLGGYYLIILASVIVIFIRPRFGILLIPSALLLLSLLWVSSIIEHRYFLTTFPFLILAATGSFLVLVDVINRRKST